MKLFSWKPKQYVSFVNENGEDAEIPFENLSDACTTCVILRSQGIQAGLVDSNKYWIPF